MKLSVSTWNMAYWDHKSLLREAWAYYKEDVDSDIKMFQESRPDYSVLHKNSLVWQEIGEARSWGSGVYSNKHPIRHFPFKTSSYGVVTAAEIEINPDMTLIVISLYGILEKINSQVYSITNLHRVLSDLTGILEGKNTRDRVILGGDFNASLQFDDKQPVKSHKVLFDRIKAYGLHNCFEGYYTNFVKTYRCKRSIVPWQNDYIFISDALVPLLKSCSVFETDGVKKLSDHNIVRIELEI